MVLSAINWDERSKKDNSHLDKARKRGSKRFAAQHLCVYLRYRVSLQVQWHYSTYNKWLVSLMYDQNIWGFSLLDWQFSEAKTPNKINPVYRMHVSKCMHVSAEMSFTLTNFPMLANSPIVIIFITMAIKDELEIVGFFCYVTLFFFTLRSATAIFVVPEKWAHQPSHHLWRRSRTLGF